MQQGVRQLMCPKCVQPLLWLPGRSFLADARPAYPIQRFAKAKLSRLLSFSAWSLKFFALKQIIHGDNALATWQPSTLSAGPQVWLAGRASHG